MIEEYKKYITKISGDFRDDSLFDHILGLKSSGNIQIKMPHEGGLLLEFNFICYEEFIIRENRKELLNEINNG